MRPLFVAVLQIGSAVALLLMSYFARPGPAGLSDLVVADYAYVIWLPPFFVFAVATLASRTSGSRANGVLAALIGNLALIVLYAVGIAGLRLWERERWVEWGERCLERARVDPTIVACPAGYPILDPPQPPLYWEVPFGMFLAGLIALYLILGPRSRSQSRIGGSSSKEALVAVLLVLLTLAGLWLYELSNLSRYAHSESETMIGARMGRIMTALAAAGPVLYLLGRWLDRRMPPS